MKLTNKFNLPEAFENFIRNDAYSRGDADISITELIDSPRVRLLKQIHAEQMEMDVVDRVWALFGTATHHILENAEGGQGVTTEERLSIEINGWRVSGAIDYQRINPDGMTQIVDYKVTSAWSVLLGDKPEWENQLNCYANLVEENKDTQVSDLKICAILRDWNRRKAEAERDYPQAPVVMIDIPLWDYVKTKDYMESRVGMHQNAQQNWDENKQLPFCSETEKWSKPGTWAVKKGENKRAVRVLQTKEEAEAYIKDNKLDDKHHIEARPGEDTRCAGNYCGVADFCMTYFENELSGGEDNDGEKETN